MAARAESAASDSPMPSANHEPRNMRLNYRFATAFLGDTQTAVLGCHFWNLLSLPQFDNHQGEMSPSLGAIILIHIILILTPPLRVLRDLRVKIPLRG